MRCTVWSVLLSAFLVAPAAVVGQTSAPAAPGAVGHPLDALTAGEIPAAVEVLRAAGRLGPQARFGLLDLAEPEKAVVAEGIRTGTFGRAARAIMYDTW